MIDPFIKPEHVQGSKEWLEHRNNYLGASDAAAVMGVSPWITPYQLWKQKTGRVNESNENFAMSRGSEMEPLARAAFEKEMGVEVFPQVKYHKDVDFMMASLDGISLEGDVCVEIKCPGKKAHDIALCGEVPAYYIPQLQHQLAVIDCPMIWYYSFNGVSGVAIKVLRDEIYIKDLIKKEDIFWKGVKSLEPPPLTNKDYQNRECPMWAAYGHRIVEIDSHIALLKKEREKIKTTLIEECNGQSSRGGGLSLGVTIAKGRVNYGKIPQLTDIILDKYREPSTERWTLRVDRKNTLSAQ